MDRLQDDADWAEVPRSEHLRKIVRAYQAANPPGPERHPVVLKVIDYDVYRSNLPSSPLGQTNPDGVRYDRVAHVPGLQRSSVQDWVAERANDSRQVMVAFALGQEMGQLPGEENWRPITLSTSDMAVVRRAARDEHRQAVEAAGFRIDHLITDDGPDDTRTWEITVVGAEPRSLPNPGAGDTWREASAGFSTRYRGAHEAARAIRVLGAIAMAAGHGDAAAVYNRWTSAVLDAACSRQDDELRLPPSLIGAMTVSARAFA